MKTQSLPFALFLAVFSLGAKAHAIRLAPVTGMGGVVGNGGGFVVCREGGKKDGKIESVELLDYFETRTIRKLTADFGADQKDWKTIAETLIQRMWHASKLRSEIYSGWLEGFEKDASFQDEIDFSVVPDTDHIGVPKGCHYEQAAVQRIPRIGKDPLYFIERSLWNAAPPAQKAGLVLHEFLYREASQIGHESSLYARYLNGYLSTASFETLNTAEKIELFQASRLEVLDVPVGTCKEEYVCDFATDVARSAFPGEEKTTKRNERMVWIPGRLAIWIGRCVDAGCAKYRPSEELILTREGDLFKGEAPAWTKYIQVSIPEKRSSQFEVVAVNDRAVEGLKGFYFENPRSTMNQSMLGGRDVGFRAEGSEENSLLFQNVPIWFARGEQPLMSLADAPGALRFWKVSLPSFEYNQPLDPFFENGVNEPALALFGDQLNETNPDSRMKLSHIQTVCMKDGVVVKSPSEGGACPTEGKVTMQKLSSRLNRGESLLSADIRLSPFRPDDSVTMWGGTDYKNGGRIERIVLRSQSPRIYASWECLSSGSFSSSYMMFSLTDDWQKEIQGIDVVGEGCVLRVGQDREYPLAPGRYELGKNDIPTSIRLLRAAYGYPAGAEIRFDESFNAVPKP